MRHIDRSGNFKQQYKLMLKRHKPEAEIKKIIVMLANDTPLPHKNKDHNLTGNWKGFRECHIEPDWLLIYKKSDSHDGLGILQLEATGTHADLF
jgi:mRNA interferase YafQ